MTKSQIEELIYVFGIDDTVQNPEEVEYLEMHNPVLLDAMRALMQLYYEATD